MAKRQMIIEIDEQDYEKLQRDSYHSFDKYMAYIAMKDGKLLPENPTNGKWIWYEVNGVNYCKCDKCHNGAWEMEFDFCSYCGADMREVKADEDSN